MFNMDIQWTLNPDHGKINATIKQNCSSSVSKDECASSKLHAEKSVFACLACLPFLHIDGHSCGLIAVLFVS